MPSTSLRASRLTTVAAASGAINWLNRATWRLFDAQGNLSPLVTATRSGTATFFNSSGVLQNAAANTPRVSYDPANLSLGPFLLAEEARTNSIRNNTMQGAVVGVPGTLPTNWAGSAAVDGLSRSIIGMPVVNGIQCVDIRFSGISGTSASVVLIAVEGNNTVAATNGQVWTSSSYLALVGGSLNNVTLLQMRQRFNDSSGSSLQVTDTFISGIVGQLQRYVASGTASNTSTAFVNLTFIANFTDNSPVDFTLRIGLPQLEQAATASSPILTYGTAVTRSADNLSVTNLAATGFNINECTVYAAWGCDVNTADNNHIITVDNNGGLPTIAMRLGNNAGRRVRAYAQAAGGSFEYAVDAPVNASATLGRSAMSWLGTNNFIAADAGGLSSLDSVGSIGAFNVNRISFGRNGAAQSNMRIYQAAIIPQRVPDSGLQRLTRV